MTHAGDLLSALIDGELTPAERRDVTGHLDECAGCRTEFDRIAAARSAVRSLPTLQPPPGLVPEAAPARRRLLRPGWGWAAAGAAAAALVVGLVLGSARPPEPMDLDTLAEQHTARVLVQPGFQTVRAEVSGP